MAKSTYDAGWGTFLQIFPIKAVNAGLMTIAVNPNGTTQDCSNCSLKVPKTIRERCHSCAHCGLELDRDHNAAINIKQRAVGHPVLKARGVLSNSRTAKREARSLDGISCFDCSTPDALNAPPCNTRISLTS